MSLRDDPVSPWDRLQNLVNWTEPGKRYIGTHHWKERCDDKYPYRQYSTKFLNSAYRFSRRKQDEISDDDPNRRWKKTQKEAHGHHLNGSSIKSLRQR